MDRHPGCCENAGNARLAQWESACLTRRWSQVQILHRALGGPAGGHRAGECRVAQANQACAPLPDRPVLRTGNRNSLARLRRTAASFDLRCRFVKGGVPPFHTFPPVMRAANLRFAASLFFRLLGGNGQERRSPTGIARERETCTNNAAPRQSHGGAPVSDRHRAGARNPHRRRRATPISRPGAPVSDRHRAGARNPHRRRRAPPTSGLRTHASPTAQNHGDMERRSPTGIARERETRTNDAAPRQSHGHEPTHRQPHRITWSMERRSPTGIARERETCTDVAAPRQRSTVRLGWRSVVGAGFALPRDAGRRPALHREIGVASVVGARFALPRDAGRRPVSRWSAGLRPASRGSAKPAPTTLRHPNLTVERRSPTGIARERETCTNDAGHPNLTVERRSPTGIARERETRTDDAGHPNLTARSAGRRPALRPSCDPESAALRDSRRYAPRCRCERPHRENWPALPGRPGRRADRHSTPGRVGNGRNLPGTLLLHLQFWRLGRWRSCTVIR